MAYTGQDESIIKLNVGGIIFMTKYSTLIPRSKYFMKLLINGDHPVAPREIFIDRSPHIFKHVLSFLRDIDYHYPRKYRKELDFYEIYYEDFPNPMARINETTTDMLRLMDKIEQHLYKIKRNANQDRLTLGPIRGSPFSSPQPSPIQSPDSPSYAAVAGSSPIKMRQPPQLFPGPSVNGTHGPQGSQGHSPPKGHSQNHSRQSSQGNLTQGQILQFTPASPTSKPSTSNQIADE